MSMDFDTAEAAGLDGTLRSGEIAQQLARAATVTDEPATHCNWCGVAITRESDDVWLDAMDDAHCEKNDDDGHQPEPTVRDFWQELDAVSSYLDTTITPTAESPVSMTWRAVLTDDLVSSTGEPVTYRVDFYRTYHPAGTNVPDDGPWHMTGDPRVGWSSAEAAMAWAEKEEHADAWDFDNDLLFKQKVTEVTAVRQAQAARDDRLAIDKIATLLGTAETWDGAADFLDDIAQIIGRVRPSVGGAPDEFAAAFLDHTGHAVDAEFDQRD